MKEERRDVYVEDDVLNTTLNISHGTGRKNCYHIQIVGAERSGRTQLFLPLIGCVSVGLFNDGFDQSYVKRHFYFDGNEIEIVLYDSSNSLINPRANLIYPVYDGYIVTIDMCDIFHSVEKRISKSLIALPSDKPILLVGTMSDRIHSVKKIMEYREKIRDIIKDIKRPIAMIETSAKMYRNTDMVLPEMITLINQTDCLDKIKVKLKKMLGQYLSRIETEAEKRKDRCVFHEDDQHTDYTPLFSYGFTFFKRSRGTNRHINYLLAAELLDKLDEAVYITDIRKMFEDVDQLRRVIIEMKNINERDHYKDRGIRSEELKQIIETGTQLKLG